MPATDYRPGTLEAGTGPDALVLKVSQDAYQGSAQYAVKVDGRQIGGTFTASALKSSGQSDTLKLKGDWGPGDHRVEVSFLNDAYGGAPSADRNLHVDGATYNGGPIASAKADLWNAGTFSFGFTEAAPPAPSFPPTSLTAGSGSDTLVLRISQDAYQGSAQYTVKVDGRQIGGTFTASALKSSGQSDTLTLKGEWAPGPHKVEVSFLNDAYGGSPTADRNLHLDSATYNGAPVSGAATGLWSAGTASFGLTDGSGGTPAPQPGSPAPSVPLGRAVTQTFNDDFNSFSRDGGGSSTGTWNTQYTWGRTVPQNGELEFYSDSSVGVNPFSIRDGALVITANHSPNQSQTGNMPYTSGAITTHGNFEQLYGYFEMRADIPQGKGLWPAFWMVPGPEYGGSPPELDIMEVIGSKADVVTSVHTDAGGYRHIYDWASDPNAFTGYHTYGVSWRPDGITFHYDGQEVFSTPNPADFQHPMYLIANLAVGGNWPGAPDGTTRFPAEMKIDYIRAWQYEDLM